MVKTRTVKTSKLQDRGVTMMFVGYNLNMGSNVYRMWNEETKRIHNTRDITWLNVCYNNRNRNTNILHHNPSVGENRSEATVGDGIGGDDFDNDNDDDDVDTDGESADEEDDDNESAEDNTIIDDSTGDDNESAYDNAIIDDRSTRRGTKTRSGRVTYRPARLIDEGVACVGAGIGDGYTSTTELKPMKLKEAMRSRDREEWKKAVEEEHNNMKKLMCGRQYRSRTSLQMRKYLHLHGS